MSYESSLVDNVLLVYWQEMTAADLDKLVGEAQRAHDRLGRKIIYVGIIDGENFKPPSSEVRGAVMPNVDRLAPLCQSINLVIRGSGLRAATWRSVATAIFLVARQNAMKFQSSIDDVLAANAIPESIAARVRESYTESSRRSA